MNRAVTIAAAGLALAAPVAAAQDEPPRLAKYVDRFSSDLPGTSTARHTETDLGDPADPEAKPKAVSHVHVELAPGTVVDTSAVSRCEASDPELMASGADACADDSRVGQGVFDFDTGFPGDNRHLVSDVVLFNAKDELVFLATQRGAGTRVVVRGQLSNGNELDVEVPPIPGTPPDGAADTAEVLDVIERPGYITTPPRCPSTGEWKHTVTYTFRDGVVQSFSTTTPCRRPEAEQRLSVSGLPKRCVRKRLRARVNVVSAAALRGVDLRVDGRRLKRVKQYRFAADVPVRSLRSGRHRLTVIARTEAGTMKRSARFRRC
jgi:hypothetical protein